VPAAPSVAAAYAAALLELVRANLPRASALGYGTDLVCLNDLDPHCAMLDAFGVEGIRQAVYHRLSTPRGLLVHDDPDYGFDLVGLLSRAVTVRDQRLAEAAIQNEVTKDDRITAARVDLKLLTARRMRVEILITPTDPAITDFSMVVHVENGASILEAR
jgi:phage baseplate assembly protein W